MSGGKFKDYCAPVTGYYNISSNYGYRGNPDGKPPRYAKWHSGVDLGSCKDRTVHAIEDGVVVRVDIPKFIPEGQRKGSSRNGWTQGLVKIRHSFGAVTYSSYVHLKEGSITVKKGQTVTKGQPIGIVGNTGYSFGAHLHFVLYDQRNKKFDPMKFLEDCSDVVAQYRILKSAPMQTKKGKSVTVPRLKVSFKAKGIYRDSNNPQGLSEEPFYARLQSSNPSTSNVPGDAQYSSTKAGSSDEQTEADDEDTRNSLLSFFLEPIVNSKDANRACLYNNIVEIDGGKNTGILQNLIFSKTLVKNKNMDYNDLTTLELSNLTPFVEMYSVKTYNEETIEILYPFDDYTSRQQVETIFYDKTTRGGSVGVNSVEYKTLATNPANKAQVSVRINLLIQDIAQIESVRNNITLLDFLYPAASRSVDEYQSRNFSVKLKVGWKYKENITTNEISKKINPNILTQILYCSLHNHSFNFRDDGLVELTMEYIGMIEAEIADPYTKNIINELSVGGESYAGIARAYKRVLEDLDSYGKDFKQLGTSELVRQSVGVFVVKKPNTRAIAENALKKAASGDREKSAVAVTKEDVDRYVENMKIPPDKITYNLNDGQGDQTLDLDEEGVNKLKEGLRNRIKQLNIDIAKSYAPGLTDFLKTASDRNKIKILSVTPEQLSEIIQINKNREYSNSNQFFSGSASVKRLEIGAKKSITNLPAEGLDEANNSIQFTESFGESSISINSAEYVKALTNSVDPKRDNINIPYIFLKDLLSYYHAKFYGAHDVRAEKELLLFLGSFSYNSMSGQGTLDIMREFAASNTSLKVEIDENGQTFVRSPASLKYANMGNIPISVKSLIDWYNTNILSSDKKTMSYHTFVRRIMTELANSCIYSNLTDFLNRKRISASTKYLTINAGKREYLKGLQKSNLSMGSDGRLQQGEIAKYGIDLTNKYKDSYFYRLLDKAVYGNERTDKNINFLFILSLNELTPALSGQYREDQEKNIPHLYVNQEKGLIKNIKFNKEDFTQLDDANIVKANRGNEAQAIIRKVYQAGIEMYGNSIFEPGQMMYLNPSYPGSRLRNPVLHKIGLGGYYQIVSINSVIDQNKFITNLDGKWVMSGVGDQKDKFVYTNIRVYLGKAERDQVEE